MSKTDRNKETVLNLDDDDIEIIEVVGLDEDSPGASAVLDDDPDDLILTLDESDSLDDASLSGVAPRAAHPVPGMSSAVGQQEISDQERLLRIQADFENMKKRLEREAEETRRQATATLISRILPVLDNFERALSADSGAEISADALRQGVALIFRQMLDELRKEGLEAIESVGQTFDPEVHEAVETGSVPEFPGDTVIEELQRGYRLRGRLLRPALVRVNVNLEDAGASATPSGE